MTLKIGVLASGTTPDEVAELEAAGADSLWASGHVTGPLPTPEAMTSLARLAALSRRATVGTAILALPLYPPVLVAKQIAEIDRWTGGRVVFGIGVGGEYPEEFRACGVPLAGRGARTDEAIGMLRALWSGRQISAASRHEARHDVHIDPLAVQAGGPPIVVAGRQAAAMRRAALLGDGWMPYLYSAAKYRRSVSDIRDRAAAAGRDLTGFRWMSSVFVTVDDNRSRARDNAARALNGALRAPGNPDFAAVLDRVAVAGNVEDVVSRLAAFVAAGAEHLILMPVGDANPHRHRLRLLSEVAPALRARGGAE